MTTNVVIGVNKSTEQKSGMISLVFEDGFKIIYCTLFGSIPLTFKLIGM